MKKSIAVVTVLAGFSIQTYCQPQLTARIAQKIASARPQSAAVQLPFVSRAPHAVDFSFITRKNFPAGQPAAKVTAPGQLDVRSGDLTAWDLSGYTLEELTDVLSFDTKTRFPAADKLPRGFNARQILENGKNPGLGVRALHAQGVTGKGVSAAIIDQKLLTTHQEYAGRLMWYEEAPAVSRGNASMHGPAVASLLLGQSVGTAPEAKLFYFAPEFHEENHRFDARPITQTLQKIQQLNARLAPADKIRVVSISRGFSSNDSGAEEFDRIKKELENSGVLVLTANDVFTLSRTHMLANPDDGSVYQRPAYWWKPKEYASYSALSKPLVPTDFRTTASPTGNADYVTYANGGLSWGVPYLAGLYALAVQVNPAITPAQFKKLAAETARPQSCEFKGEKFQATRLVDPAALLQAVRKLNK